MTESTSFKSWRKCDIGYSQHEETGTLMARTNHTMSILSRQMVFFSWGGSCAGPDWFPDPHGPCVVAGTCLFMKLPLAVEGASEMFESFAAGHESSVLLITSVALFKETRESMVTLVVPPPWISPKFTVFAEEVGLDVVTWLEGRAGAGGGDWLPVCAKALLTVSNGRVGFSIENTSRNVMVWCKASLSVFCPLWILKFEDNEGDVGYWMGSFPFISPVSVVPEMSSAPGATSLWVPERKEWPEPESVAWFTGFLLIVLGLSVLMLKFWSRVLVVKNPELVLLTILLEVSWGASTSGRGTLGCARSLEPKGCTPTVVVWIMADGTVFFGVWNEWTVVGLLMASRAANEWMCRSPVLEPSCQLKGPGERVVRVLLLVDIETKSRGVWLGWSSSVENTSPTGTDRISRTPEKDKQAMRRKDLLVHNEFLTEPFRDRSSNNLSGGSLIRVWWALMNAGKVTTTS